MSIEEIKLNNPDLRAVLPSERIVPNFDQFSVIPLKFYFHERK